MIIINEAKRRWMRDHGEGDSNFINRLLIVTCYEKRDNFGFFMMIEF